MEKLRLWGVRQLEYAHRRHFRLHHVLVQGSFKTCVFTGYAYTSCLTSLKVTSNKKNEENLIKTPHKVWTLWILKRKQTRDFILNLFLCKLLCLYVSVAFIEHNQNIWNLLTSLNKIFYPIYIIEMTKWCQKYNHITVFNLNIN